MIVFYVFYVNTSVSGEVNRMGNVSTKYCNLFINNNPHFDAAYCYRHLFYSSLRHNVLCKPRTTRKQALCMEGQRRPGWPGTRACVSVRRLRLAIGLSIGMITTTAVALLDSYLGRPQAHLHTQL